MLALVHQKITGANCTLHCSITLRLFLFCLLRDIPLAWFGCSVIPRLHLGGAVLVLWWSSSSRSTLPRWYSLHRTARCINSCFTCNYLWGRWFWNACSMPCGSAVSGRITCLSSPCYFSLPGMFSILYTRRCARRSKYTPWPRLINFFLLFSLVVAPITRY